MNHLRKCYEYKMVNYRKCSLNSYAEKYNLRSEMYRKTSCQAKNFTNEEFQDYMQVLAQRYA